YRTVLLLIERIDFSGHNTPLVKWVFELNFRGSQPNLKRLPSRRTVSEETFSNPPFFGSYYFPPDPTRRFRSSNQLSTTLICVAASSFSLGLIITSRWPSGVTSYSPA